MNYTKPEVAVLGEATQVIQGVKALPKNSDGPLGIHAAYDLDE